MELGKSRVEVALGNLQFAPPPQDFFLSTTLCVWRSRTEKSVNVDESGIAMSSARTGSKGFRMSSCIVLVIMAFFLLFRKLWSSSILKDFCSYWWFLADNNGHLSPSSAFEADNHSRKLQFILNKVLVYFPCYINLCSHTYYCLILIIVYIF